MTFFFGSRDDVEGRVDLARARRAARPRRRRRGEPFGRARSSSRISRASSLRPAVASAHPSVPRKWGARCETATTCSSSRNAFFEATQCDPGLARVVQGGGVLLFERERVLEEPQGFLRPAVVEQAPSGELIGKGGERIGLPRAIEERQTLLEPLARTEDGAERGEGENVGRLELDGPPPGGFHRIPAPFDPGGEGFDVQRRRPTLPAARLPSPAPFLPRHRRRARESCRRQTRGR